MRKWREKAENNLNKKVEIESEMRKIKRKNGGQKLKEKLEWWGKVREWKSTKILYREKSREFTTRKWWKKVEGDNSERKSDE